MSIDDDPWLMFEKLVEIMFEGPCIKPLPTDEAARLREHLDGVLTEHRIILHEKPIGWMDADGGLETRDVVVPELGSELAYFVALHECGHVVLGLESFAEGTDVDGSPIRRYDNEATVWEWAIDTALMAPSEDAEEKILKYLASSEPGPGREAAPGRVRESCAARRAREDPGPPVDP
jgi:hypothetical protein